MSAQRPKGFTLIELMVAIAIIAVLAAVGLVVYGTAQKAGRISKRAQDLEALRTAIELYKVANGVYPGTSSGACINGATTLAGLVPAYMPTLPADPLDGGNPGGTNCYRYIANATFTQFKVHTNSNLYPNEMSDTDFRQQPTLINPADLVDLGSNNCRVDPPAAGAGALNDVKGWAVYSIDSSSATSCQMLGGEY